ncbi:fatty acyl-CoA reductase 3-like isoform X2 [Momordica charantia]|uniref:Fatty acyl-CoA reductase n=1 Tax=Momordica charantia TaxID=3673 RepID=A0A6J1DFP2_MOMCH|nr:fatty acyl-CoA reductase 3-like isoform X2 [Momordica charantia]
MEFLENKSVFIIGALGFLGKIMVEKILRVQPNVKKLYILVRTTDEITAAQRFYYEVVGKDLFTRLKDKWRGDLNTLISEKVRLVAGDISLPNMGLKDSNLLEEMKNQVEIIVNLAATTKFYERYDVAFGTNTLGAKHVLGFAKQCSNLQVLVHVSTGEKKGLILETPYEMGKSLYQTTSLNIETERIVVEETLNELRNNGGTEERTTLAMKQLGLKRAMMHGWPNTYVFTKAMGEMVVSDQKDHLPLVIIRPTVITSTCKEPFPGWIEGVRTIDSLIVGYAKGKLTSIPCDNNSILDVIPADMVVNTIVMAIVAHKLQPSSQRIYHVGSSLRNSMRYIDLKNFLFQYFIEKPWIDEDGNAIKVKKIIVFNNMASFRRHMSIRYLIFLKVLEFANKASCHSLEDLYADLKRKFDWMVRLTELYRPYLFFDARFDDTNLEKLRIATQDIDRDANTLFLDPRDINWEDYFVNIHIPGLVKHVQNKFQKQIVLPQ